MTFHTHVDSHAWEVRAKQPSARNMPKAIVTAAIEMADGIMKGEYAFSIEYAPDGRPLSFGMSPKDALNPLRDGSVAVGSNTERYWDWQGEIATV
ncbi:hypothetical protein [Novosphingobium sp. Gsoil 351]|uniref:hypothetical protein n=1 Tax=Novosphingobium sp. Gsoil 351 TaxID=2675225 RepID=UPI0012B45F98|nr:hypothetical protein [Novosphingobium sp. Gsoil 351]QGN55610.1 hypothetical protein GKE62_14730 [Novosphingobium sp. Gsoil 351]